VEVFEWDRVDFGVAYSTSWIGEFGKYLLYECYSASFEKYS